MKIIQLLLAGSLFIAACNNKSGDKKENTKKDTATAPVVNDTTGMPGSDRDEHGCIASAGYRWSEVKKECIRIWEAGTELKPAEAVADKTKSAFVVLSSDNKTAEVYLPSIEGNSVIFESEKSNKWVNGAWTLERIDNLLVLKQVGVIQYAQ